MQGWLDGFPRHFYICQLLKCHYHDAVTCKFESTENGNRMGHRDSRPRKLVYVVYYMEYLSACVSDTSIRCLAGAASGAASSMVTCPLDVIKTRLQGRDGLQLWTLDPISKRRSFINRGLVGTGRAIWQERGLVGMYQGLGPTMLATLPRGAIYFTVYHKANGTFRETFAPQHMWTTSIAAVVGGCCSIICTNPLWVIKTRLMSQRITISANMPYEYKSAVDVARKMYCREGMASFYSGLTPALLGVTHLAIQFPLYDWFKRYLTGSGLGNWRADQGIFQVLGILTASSASKVCATLATYPHEVIRTRLQTQNTMRPDAKIKLSQSYGGLSGNREGSRGGNGDMLWKKSPIPYRGIIRTIATIWREEGWRALYSGMGTSLIGAIPASATAMLVYEVIVHLLNSRMKGLTSTAAG